MEPGKCNDSISATLGINSRVFARLTNPSSCGPLQSCCLVKQSEFQADWGSSLLALGSLDEPDILYIYNYTRTTRTYELDRDPEGILCHQYVIVGAAGNYIVHCMRWAFGERTQEAKSGERLTNEVAKIRPGRMPLQRVRASCPATALRLHRLPSLAVDIRRGMLSHVGLIVRGAGLRRIVQREFVERERSAQAVVVCRLARVHLDDEACRRSCVGPDSSLLASPSLRYHARRPHPRRHTHGHAACLHPLHLFRPPLHPLRRRHHCSPSSVCTCVTCSAQNSWRLSCKRWSLLSTRGGRGLPLGTPCRNGPQLRPRERQSILYVRVHASHSIVLVWSHVLRAHRAGLG